MKKVKVKAKKTPKPTPALKRVTRKCVEPATEETPRISRRKRRTKKPRSPTQEKKRQERALAKKHPHAKTVNRVRKIAAPKPPDRKHPVAETDAQRKRRQKREQRERTIQAEEGQKRYDLIFGPMNAYLGAVRLLRAKAKLIRRRYREVFDERAPKGVPLELLKTRTAYELLVRGYLAAGEDVPEKVLVNHKAARRFNVEGFTPSQREMLEIQLAAEPNHSTEETNMTEKTRKKVKGKKAKGTKGTKGKGAPSPIGRGMKGSKSGLTQKEYWIKLFNDNRKQKLSDEKLCAVMSKEFPGSERLKQTETIRTHRAMYNRGALGAQDGVAPKVPCPQFDAKGNPVDGRASSSKPAKSKKTGTKSKGKSPKGEASTSTRRSKKARKVKGKKVKGKKKAA